MAAESCLGREESGAPSFPASVRVETVFTEDREGLRLTTGIDPDMEVDLGLLLFMPLENEAGVGTEDWEDRGLERDCSDFVDRVVLSALPLMDVDELVDGVVGVVLVLGRDDIEEVVVTGVEDVDLDGVGDM